ncbi:MAG: spore maturation protein [Chitinispirillaceae bacterium]|nr:spore maturation protein [Chitinispirillaceae bacterium]
MKSKIAAINYIWFFLIIGSIIVASYNGKMEAISKATFESAKNAVNLAISLIGAMAFWLGIMKVVEDAGLTHTIARIIKPAMSKLFPDVPPEHPAMSAMIMNISANMLGLGNAATPFGIKAMIELDKLNKNKGIATDAMCLFLAINTSSVTLLPLGVISVRAAAGATKPSSILIPSLLATTISTLTAIIVAKLLARKNKENTLFYQTISEDNNSNVEKSKNSEASLVTKITVFILILLLIGGLVYQLINKTSSLSFENFTKGSEWLIPLLIFIFLCIGYLKGVKIYESLVEGAKEGFNVAIRIIPYMVAIFVAIGIFRESGALDILSKVTSPVTQLIGMPSETLPLAFLRPLSGTGSFGVMSEIINKSPDSFESFVASVMQGSTETTFYVLTVYFGAISVTNIRYSIVAALSADAAGILSSVFLSNLMYRLFYP